MTPEQKKFLDRAVIKREKYKDIAREMNLPEKQLSAWWEELKTERLVLARVRGVWLKKCTKIDFWQFHHWYTSNERKCHYCGLDEDLIARLIEHN
jgi:hypothetical protein